MKLFLKVLSNQLCLQVCDSVTIFRVGHVYRKVTPHSIPGSLAEQRDRATINTARFARVWLDDYRDWYEALNPDARRVDVGDLTSRLDVRRRLKCHNFQWFLDNVYKDAPIPNQNAYFGKVMHNFKPHVVRRPYVVVGWSSCSSFHEQN